MNASSQYWSCAMEGVPFGVRYPSELMARDAARKHMECFKDIERIQIVQVQLASLGYEGREAKPYNPFDGAAL